MELPLITAKKLIKFLKKRGLSNKVSQYSIRKDDRRETSFPSFVRQKGSHAFYRHPDGRTTVVPIHPGRKIKKGLLKGILNEIKISREYFLKNIK